MNNIAYINGIKVDLETAGIVHRIKSKIALDIKLTPKERSYYLLFIATIEEAKGYLKNEKNRHNEK